ncbi:P-loop containing nucleoside triphosphate hydrolase protein [Massariosphaeria phaeospora]|uniref:RNA helicase n=1 Tax=Massariosphaeria phaeospora TaxID=100035 RepID=A0A7C8I8L5_9PLEO|nr:P-loop containing nucleoside triphosphate hydrolase protein [Massariosphaeria phaeospora]
MPPLPPRRPSLCLFCASAARRRLQARKLPVVQVAHRSAPPAASKRARHDEPHLAFNKSPLSYQPPRRTYDIISWRLSVLLAEFVEPEFLESLQFTRKAFDKEWRTFESSVDLWVKQRSPEFRTLTETGSRSGYRLLDSKLRQMFYAQACGGRFTDAELNHQKEVADLRYPAEWYPATREIPRTVHLHVGPTNSGKTYHALKRLEEAESGIYLGPLRLLAHEVYTRLNAKGKPCALVTGEEQRVPEGPTRMWSCTVEMAPLNAPLDVAVIDEIQMINHPERGWAWTQAFFGLQAKELHLCGEERTVPLMRELCALVGDKVEVHEYERLTPLKVAARSLDGKLDRLEKGDCIVSFSVIGIHALRREIEKKSGKKCAIVYGSLPPETRAQQARLFNDPDNEYDYLVASDAVGMGLNLSIKRVIFESTWKNNGQSFVPLQIPEIKQIAGRAGRYKSAHQAINQDLADKAASDKSGDPTIGLDDVKPDSNSVPGKPSTQTVGYVTTLDRTDFDMLKKGMVQEAEVIRTAGLFPPAGVVERFSSYFPPGTPFSYIMSRLHEICNIHPRFHLCALKDQLTIADTIHLIKNLTIADRITICSAPANMKDKMQKKFLFTLASCIANNASGDLLDLEKLPLEYLDQKPSPDREYLYQLELLHKMLVAYLWLSYRFPNVFTTRTLANHVKKLVEDRIESTLSEFSFTRQTSAAIIMKKREAAMHKYKKHEAGRKGNTFRPTLRDDQLPQPVKDVLEDPTFLAQSEPAMDDATPELEVLESEDVEPLEKQHQQLSGKAQGLGKGELPPNLDLARNQPESRL